MSSVLSSKDVNAPLSMGSADPGRAGDLKKTATTTDADQPDVLSMEYHRQVLHSKMAQQDGKTTYVSPSDNIMSPCTKKLNAYRNKQVGKAKPKSLFAQASARKMGAGPAGDDGLFAGTSAATRSRLGANVPADEAAAFTSTTTTTGDDARAEEAC